MRDPIDVNTLIGPLAARIRHALTHVDASTVDALRAALATETHGPAKWALTQILENDAYAAREGLPACQDTGLCVFFVELGCNVRLNGNLTAALNEAVASAYVQGYFRKSVVASPLARVNTEDNTPAIVHYEMTDGDALRISFLAKGAGSENMSATYMLTPSQGTRGIVEACVECVRRAGANPCPPIVLGVGIGGNAEHSALIAKRALLRPCGTPSPDPQTAALEQEILAAVNGLGIGVQGFGGAHTALAVHVETAPTHIGMLPVSVCLQCHSARHFVWEV